MVDRLKQESGTWQQESGVRQHHSANSALIKAIESAVWIPSVDSTTPKSTHHMTESEPSGLSDSIAVNKTHLEVSATDSTDVTELTDKTVCKKSAEQQGVGDRSCC